ncbi:MAG TPA: hypothetical protein VMC10_05800 [Stellaceae bacterium]|nr:hypothetical protein [Stellaceae bacterium]
MSISGIGGAAAYSYFPTPTSSQSNSAAATGQSTDVAGSAAQSFLKYMNETPAQKLEDAWLKEHNLTRAQLDAMPPAQREAIEKEMAADIQQKLKQQALDNANKQTGGNLDVTA